MTKSKAYYEAYLVLQCLSDVEYKLIPKELLDEITSKMEKDESIAVDPNIPLENQKLSDKTYDILDKVISSIEKAYGKDAIDHPEDVDVTKNNKVEEIDLSDVKPIDKAYNYNTYKGSSESNLKEENIKLKNIIESLKVENQKVDQAKDLVLNYKELVEKKDVEINKLKEEITKLQGDNADLYSKIQKVPKLFRRVFFKDTVKLLK